LGEAFNKLVEFVDYVEKKARDSTYGFDPHETLILRTEFEQLKVFAEEELGEISLSDLFLIEGKFNTILAEAESRFKINKIERDCKNLRLLVKVLLAILSALGAIIAKLLIG
jgi:hypothetical protein